MKRLAILLALLMLAACLTACGTKNAAPTETTPDKPAPETPTAAAIPGGDVTAAPTELTEAPSEPTEVPNEPTLPPVYTTEAPTEPTRRTLEDFTVETIDGGHFTLSEALRDHELVLINLWASWCGPCAGEFPYLQEAWEPNQDKVAVIALSVEPDDSMDLLRKYAEQRGLTFPIGRAEGTDLMETFSPAGLIPTTILVDRSGSVVAVEIGSKSSARDFLDLFSQFVGADYQAPTECTYTLVCMDMDGHPVPNCTFSFCTEELCMPTGTDASGVAVFIGAPADYHIQVVSLPEGYELNEEASQLVAGPYTTTLLVYLSKQAP